MTVLSEVATLLYWIPCLLALPIYLMLSPLCLISSSLFDWTISFIVDDQTLMLIAILLVVWLVSFALIFQLMRNRSSKEIFFYEFVFFLSGANFIMIGVTYKLLQRHDLTEEVCAKIFTTLLLVYIAEKIKIKKMDKEEQCAICFNCINENDCIQLKCKHYYHEPCLWDWVYVKPECPVCRTKIQC